jgi:hypothetical protein
LTYPGALSIYRLSPNKKVINESSSPMIIGPRIGPGFLTYPEHIDTLTGGGYGMSKFDYLGLSSGNVTWPGWSCLITGLLDYGYPQVNKQWRRIKLELSPYSGVSTTPYAYWRKSINEAFEGSNSLAMQGNKYVFTIPNSVISPQLQVKVIIIYQSWGSPIANVKDYVEVESVEVEGLLAGPITPQRRRYSFDATVVDNLELLDGTVENSAGFVAVAINSLVGIGTSQIVALPWPVVGHTVEAVISYGGPAITIPVMSYSLGAGIIPGAHIALTVTEV